MGSRKSAHKRERTPRTSVSDTDRIFYALSGTTEADNALAACARLHVMDALVQVPRVRTAFARWAKRYGLTNRAETVKRWTNDLAHALAFDSRGSLFLKNHHLDIADVAPQTLTKLRRLRAQSEKACSRFWEAVDQLPSSFFHDVARLAKEDLRLPWVFVVGDLIEYFIHGLWGYASGLTYHRRGGSAPKPITLPSMTVESQSELLAAYERARHRLPKGRKGRTSEKIVATYACWFVRHHVGGETLSHLFSEYHRGTYHAERECDAECANEYRLVSKGIDRIRRLLNLHQYHFPSNPLCKSPREL